MSKTQTKWDTLTAAALLIGSPFLFFSSPNRLKQELPEKL